MKKILILIIIFLLLYNWYNNLRILKLAKNISEKVKQEIYILPNFLNKDSFRTIKNKLKKFNKYKTSNNYIRKGSAISNNNLRNQKEINIILKLLDTPETLYNIHKRTNLNIQFMPKVDINYISILSYNKAGDFIDWHKDGNIYYGNRWVGILTIINKGKNNRKSSGNFLYKIDNKENKINASENTLILFRGDKIEHKIEPIKEGDKRIVISMLFCDVCYQKTDIISLLYQKMVDFTFY